jgi:hypothetical protein
MLETRGGAFVKIIAVWAFPACMAICGILLAIARHDPQLGERSAFVMISTVVVAILDVKLT